MRDRTVGPVTSEPWIERLSLLFLRENLLKHRWAIEWIAAGVVFLLVLLGEVGRFSGIVSAVASTFIIGAFALLVAFHRVVPPAAVAASIVLMLFTVLTGGLWYTGSFAYGLPLLVVMFGAAAYGGPATRWAALTIPVLAVFEVAYVSYYIDSDASFYYSYSIWRTGVGAVAVVLLLIVPWIAGLVLRAEAARRRTQKSEIAVVAQRDELEVSVALEQERNRVARDVHDIVAHSLAVVIAQADGARYLAKKNPESVDEALETIATTARGALSDVRLLLTELRHTQEPGPQPGMADFDSLIRSFRESGLAIEWTSYGTATPLGDAAGLAVYRIVQEALTNSLRHGGRETPVDLEFDWTEGAVTITITNDLPEGERSANTSGHGIPGMRERAALAGGSFSAGEGTNSRFRVRATLPIDRTATPTQPMAIRPEDRP